MDDLHSIDDRTEHELAIDALLTARVTELGDSLAAPAATVETVTAVIERGRGRRRRDALVGRVAVVLAFLVLASGITLAVWPRDRGGDVDTTPFATTPSTTSSATFGYEPGWHDLDPTPFEPRAGASVTWTGKKIVVFGGQHIYQGSDGTVVPGPTNPGGVAYDLAAKTSGVIAPSPLPVGEYVGVWTGHEIVYLGNTGEDREVSSGAGSAAYDPSTDTWRTLATPPREDAAPELSGFAWTGHEIIVPRLLSRYEPATDTWRPMTAPPAALAGHFVSAWSGRELIFATWYDAAAAYDPAKDQWRMLPPAPKAEVLGPTMAATSYGGGVVFVDFLGSAKAFDTATEQWRVLTVPAMSPTKCRVRAVTFGTAAVLDFCSQLVLLDANDQFRAIDRGTTESFSNPTLVVAGGTLVAWTSTDDTLNDARAPFTSFRLWVPTPDLAPAPGPGAGPQITTTSSSATGSGELGVWYDLDKGPLSDRDGAVSVWTGHELIVFGGVRQQGDPFPTPLTDGAAYDPATKVWRTIPDAPLRGGSPVATWTGTEMFVWVDPNTESASNGPYWDTENAGNPARPRRPVTGAAFDPATNAWRSLAGAMADPNGLRGVVAQVGAEILLPHLGLAYDPATDSYRDLPASAINLGVAVWTGSQLIAVGTTSTSASLNPAIAERYDPATNAWTAIAAPPGINAQSLDVVWTGARVVVATYDLHAAALDPASGVWSPLADAPLRFGECSMHLEAVHGLVVAELCGAAAILDRTDRWTPIRSNRSPLQGTAVDMSGDLLRWASTSATDNGSKPGTSFQRFDSPALDDSGKVTSVPAVLIGWLLYDMPDEEPVNVIQRKVEQQGLVQSVVVTVDPPSGGTTGDPGACAITVTYYGMAGEIVFGDWRAKATTPGDTVTLSGGATKPGFVLLPGELDARAHVIIQLGTSDLADVACASLADAQTLLTRLRPLPGS
jgi:hypothetical protein